MSCFSTDSSPWAKTERFKQFIREFGTLNKLVAGRTDKKYYEENKEKIKEYNKEYREENKEKINEKRAEKIHCECGSSICKDKLSRHKKSQ